MKVEPGSYHCVSCYTNWPRLIGDNGLCPFLYRGGCCECGARCEPTDAIPIDVDKAWSRKRHVDFEKFCAEREKRLKAEQENRLKEFEVLTEEQLADLKAITGDEQ